MNTSAHGEVSTASEPSFAALPTTPGLARFTVLFAVFLCASCGMVYELALIALGSYLLGNTIVQASIVLAVMVFAMGVGSLATKRLVSWAAVAFAGIEAALGVLGGLSVLFLYVAFAYLDVYTGAMVVIAFMIGALIGAEIPLLMELVQRIRAQRASSAVADLFAADYVGGLIGGLAFPFVLLPLLGLTKGALAVGAVNALTGVLVVLWLLRKTLARRLQVVLAAVLVVVLAVLAGAWVLSESIEITARQQLYRDPIVLSQRSDYQEIVVTRAARNGDTRLFLNGDLQFASSDEYRYHESLVHPVMSQIGQTKTAGASGAAGASVLILGGGDGLALREVLRYDQVGNVTLVDLDPAVVTLARTNPELRRFNEGSFDDPRVTVTNADAFSWLRETQQKFDAVVVDLPDPDDVPTAKLYTVEFYGLVSTVLAPGARMVVQAGSPYFAPDAFWGIGESVREAGFAVTPYHVDVPSFGDWGYFLAAQGRQAPEVRVAPAMEGRLRFMSAEVAQASVVFPPDRSRESVGEVHASTLLRPRILDAERKEWVGY